jgi:hypothetical protein
VSRFHGSRVAVTSNGAIVLNVAHLGTSKIALLVARALENKAEIFIGVVIAAEERDELLKRVEDLAEDVVGDVAGEVPKEAGEQQDGGDS